MFNITFVFYDSPPFPMVLIIREILRNCVIQLILGVLVFAHLGSQEAVIKFRGTILFVLE